MLFAFSIIAGCGGSGSSTHAPEAASAEVVAGSGEVCPNVDGDYLCTSTDLEKSRGDDQIRMHFRQHGNADQQPVLTYRTDLFSQDYLEDGNVHDAKFADANVRYAIDCHATTLSLHAVSPGHFNYTSTMHVVRGALRFIEVTGEFEGKPDVGHRTCHKLK